MSKFALLLDKTVSTPGPKWRTRTLPAAYALAHVPQAQGELELHARFYTCITGELRSVLILAPKIEIINLFFFPSAHCLLPVYALGFVMLGRKSVVTVLDVPDLSPQISTLGRDLLNNAHRQFPDLVDADDPPAWYQSCRSGADFFVRPQNVQALEYMEKVHLQIWQALSRHCVAPQRVPHAILAARQQALEEYKVHHRDNTPGLRLLQNSFGYEWTRTFLEQYWFGPEVL